MVFLITADAATQVKGDPEFLIKTDMVSSLLNSAVRAALLNCAGKESLLVGTLGIECGAGLYTDPAIPDPNLSATAKLDGEAVYYDTVDR